MQEARREWLYAENPAGPPETYLLRWGTTPVGVATVSPRLMHLNGIALTAGFLVDFVVAPEHRSFFPALLLQKEVLRLTGNRYALLFGTPNPRSEAVVKRAGYRCVGRMVRFARVLKVEPYLSRYLPLWVSTPVGAALDLALAGWGGLRSSRGGSFRPEWRDSPGPDFDELWSICRESRILIGQRDAVFLRWRFGRTPYGCYRFLTLSSRSGGGLAAYAACRERDGAMHVEDFVVRPHAQGASAALWSALIAQASRNGLRSLSVAFMGSEGLRRELKAFGMVARSEEPVYAAWSASCDIEAAQWHLTGADQDA